VAPIRSTVRSDLRTKESSTSSIAYSSRAPPYTSVTASKVNPSANTEQEQRTSRSSGLSKSNDQPIAWRNVW
jgi:hypothetical protein